MDKFTHLGNADVNAIDALYQRYRTHPEDLDESWQLFFRGFEFSKTDYSDNGTVVDENFAKEFRVMHLIHDYRARGHLFTQTNPVRSRRPYSPSLDLENYGLAESDLDLVFQAGKELGLGKTTLRDILEHLKRTFCTSIGTEFMFIRNVEHLEWLKREIHLNDNTPNYTSEEKLEILTSLSNAYVLENFLHKKFVGQKRFSLEGGESLIPALDVLVEKGATLGICEFVLGMAHRGRLNVLINIFGKDPLALFNEFAGKDYDDEGFDGDVKYHLGHSTKRNTRSGKEVSLTLCPNPSHLETVDPIVGGLARARLDQHLHDESKICPILIHGDAAIAGQGIVYEVVQMAGLPGYRTGGTIHIVINNQVGFTTNYIDGRTSTYCTDVAKVTLSPVFHVNGDDPEAVVHAMTVALRYRQTFKHDVFVDLLCYRKYGHNEGDEPRFTQPLLYKFIAKHPNPRDVYASKLLQQEVVSKDYINKLEKDFTNLLDEKHTQAIAIPNTTINNFLEEIWCDLRPTDLSVFEREFKTSIPVKKLLQIGKTLTELPGDKHFFKKIEKLVDDRRMMLFEAGSLDWAMGELLAYATLLSEGHSVRISGQDVERGTFSHRHAVITQEDSEERYVPLRTLESNGARFHIFNSLLSEYGVLGFEYGYALCAPNDLVIWEAQFGDFFNGAQIIFDQYISAAEDKWKIQNGLVLLLPHGYEGQGAEHSSARIERFLTLCAEKNMLIVNCTTPANFFHVLRRQMKQPFRKPLVVFTPKSLLRHPKCVSPLDDFAKGGFNLVYDDSFVPDKNKIKRVLLMSGKVYYDLLEEREKRAREDVALIRIEQLYPFPTTQVEKILSTYRNATSKLWVQEEPQNMGAWSYMHTYHGYLGLDLVSIPRSASPATGSSTRHKMRVKQLMEEAFTI